MWWQFWVTGKYLITLIPRLNSVLPSQQGEWFHFTDVGAEAPEGVWCARAPPIRFSSSPVHTEAAVTGWGGDLEVTLWAEKETPASHKELLLLCTKKWIDKGCFVFTLDWSGTPPLTNHIRGYIFPFNTEVNFPETIGGRFALELVGSLYLLFKKKKKRSCKPLPASSMLGEWV